LHFNDAVICQRLTTKLQPEHGNSMLFRSIGLTTGLFSFLNFHFSMRPFVPNFILMLGVQCDSSSFVYGDAHHKIEGVCCENVLKVKFSPTTLKSGRKLDPFKQIL
jgi:hypothetical protein